MEQGASKTPAPADDMADSRRLKKRELDRKAQRLARERTKSRIAELEAMVAHLRDNDANAQISALVDQLSQVTRERDKALQVLRSLDTSIQRHLNAATNTTQLSTVPTDDALPPSHVSASSRTDASSETHRDQGCDPPPVAVPERSTNSAIWDDDLGCLGGNVAITFNDNINHQGCMDVSTLPDLPTNTASNVDVSGEDVIVPKAMILCHCTSSNGHYRSQKPFNKWRAANESLGRSKRLSRPEIIAEDLTSEDTPIRAVLEGWDSVEQSGKMTDSWRKLRGVDEVCFQTCSQIERLAILRMMHLLMTYHGDPTLERHASLPHWFLMRPSQAIEHSYAIDYFVWPGVRERFIFSQHQYCTNLFWDLFRSSFKILWPFDFRDTYMQNSQTGRFQISPLFEERIRDINTWTMSPDFFLQFPELYGDIPTYMGVPPSVSNAASGLVSYFPETQRAEERRKRHDSTVLQNGLLEAIDI
ncbi:hypothetical protein QQX98_003732 [Neonectria punicea]|uniref:BZIP transcription factor n=1 Tax=Neonectria punicea TaxID=979145 RepID=A0ABR1HCZ0_9HYPO